MSGDTEEVTRLRKPRFSYEENQILIREVRAHYPLLYGAQSRRLSVSERRRVWEGIAAQINAITSWKRTAQEVQKRWNDFKRRTKEKLARVPHSTQSGTAEDSLTAEEETIFAILGPGVMAGRGHYSSATRLGAMDFHPLGPGSSSAENSLSGPFCSPEAPILLHPKDSPSPTSQLNIVQLPHMTPTSDRSEGHSPPPQGSGSPMLSPNGITPHFDPAVAMLRAQQETADAIRHLTYTLRQSMDRLTNVLAAILPLVPTSPPPSGVIPSTYFPTKTEPEAEPCDPVSYEDDEEEEEGEANERGEAGAEETKEDTAEPPRSPSPPPPNKRKRFGYLTPRKRRGRWKNI
ncbi:myb-related transcription factor, partner of profilin [Pelobates fuscus]|uniref:myb-related transcription factor, partner of profilin n=1 Tax=Pelobates fuscus TaxID=191477 RepID=UPI002FE4781C